MQGASDVVRKDAPQLSLHCFPLVSLINRSTEDKQIGLSSEWQRRSRNDHSPEPALEDDALLRMADAHHGLYRVGVQREPLVCLHHFDVQQFLAGNTEERKRERSCGH